MSELAVDIKNLCKTYAAKGNGSAKEALKNVDLQIKRGSFFGLLGPNGAGKSTLINIIAGLVNKTSGDVKICGIDAVTDPQDARRKIGVVPQELVLDPFFPVYETLEFYAGYYGIPKEKRRTMEIIKALGLEDKAHAKARSLSGGMRRRLLVAKALVHAPEILILDEPTAGVDVELRNQLWDYVRELNQAGTTVLLTTHYLEEAEELCDEIAVINHGKVITCDSKKNLMKILSNKELIVWAAAKINPEIKEVFPNLDVKILEDDKLSISYDPAQIEVDDILREISKQNIRIKDIQTKQPDLEEIFKFLVKNK